MPHPNQPVAVRHPDGYMDVLDPARDYPDDDVLVKAYPSFFTAVENAGQIIDSVTIEDATAEPGRKRRVNVKK